MKSTDRLPLWVLVQRLEDTSAELGFTIEQFRLVCCKLMPEWYGDRPEATRPTFTEPGSEDRIREMAKRAAKGRSVFHSQDTIVHGGGFVSTERSEFRIEIPRGE